MKLTLKKIEIVNFKGIRELTANLFEKTVIRGKNKSGKSTVFDAVYWALFGKNANDETKFSVKTLDENNNAIPNLEHSVQTHWDIDSSEEVFMRGLKENWVKPHGAEEKEYKGDKQLFEINAVPKQKKDFDAEIDSYISADLFKMLSNPNEFNRIPWEKGRNFLLEMVGGISDTDIANQMKADISETLFQKIIGGKFETYRQEIRAKIKPLKDKLNECPIKIKEQQRDMPGPLNWLELEAEKSELERKLKSIEESILDKSKAAQKVYDENKEIYDKIGKFENKIAELKSHLSVDAGNENRELKQRKTTLENQVQYMLEDVRNLELNIEKWEKQLQTKHQEKELLIQKWHEINKSTFTIDENDLICPVCKREYDNIEEMREKYEGNFNEDKAEKLALNVQNGKAVAKQIGDLEKQIKEAKNDQDLIAVNINEVNQALNSMVIPETKVPETSPEIESLKVEIEALQSKLAEPSKVDNENLLVEKQKVNDQIKAVDEKLQINVDIEKKNNRITEIKAEQKKLSQEIANLEREEINIERFEKTKMTELEEKVNKLFKYVSFKMFEQQKNGGLKPDCITLINGVPYSDANTASKINAGVEICNVMQRHYGVFVPIFVDNRESCTELIEVDTQIINLVVDAECETLKIENNE